MRLNAKKTKAMYVCKNPYKHIIIEGEVLEIVTDFIYLGSSKASDGSCSQDIKRRIAQAKTKMISLKNIWKDKDLSYQLKMKIMKVLIWTTITYGAEGWSLKADDINKIKAAEMWCYHRLLSITCKDRRTNLSVLEQLNTNRQLYGIVVKRKLSYFGHMNRSKSTITKDIIQGKIEGKRNRGRPRSAYMDNIRQWTKMSTHEAFQATRDRVAWREVCWKAVQAANLSTDDAAKK